MPEEYDESCSCDESSGFADSCTDTKNAFSSTEKKVFKSVDRDKEDLLVRKYRETKDQAIMCELFALREPTLWVLARKFSWLDNEADMFSEFKGVWANCLQQYEYEAKMRTVRTKDGGIVYGPDGKPRIVLKRTPFNTYLLTSVRNRAWNMIKKRNAIKKLDFSGRSVMDTMKSLEYKYGDEGDSLTLHDTVADSKSEKVDSPIITEELIGEVSDGDSDVRAALTRFLQYGHIDKLSTACNLRFGTLQIGKDDLEVLIRGGDEAIVHLKELIGSTGNYPRHFKLLNYAVYPGRVQFEAVVKNEKVLFKLKKALDGHITKLKISQCKGGDLRSGVLHLSDEDRDVLCVGGKVAQDRLADMIASTEGYPCGFRLISYQLYPGRVLFDVAVNEGDHKSDAVAAVGV